MDTDLNTFTWVVSMSTGITQVESLSLRSLAMHPDSRKDEARKTLSCLAVVSASNAPQCFDIVCWTAGTEAANHVKTCTLLCIRDNLEQQ